jgi:hypothetical protein
MWTDYRAVFRIKTGEESHPGLEAVRAMLTLALMRSEVWLTQELQERGDLEIELTSVDIHDWNSEGIPGAAPNQWRRRL